MYMYKLKTLAEELHFSALLITLLQTCFLHFTCFNTIYVYVYITTGLEQLLFNIPL